MDLREPRSAQLPTHASIVASLPPLFVVFDPRRRRAPSGRCPQRAIRTRWVDRRCGASPRHVRIFAISLTTVSRPLPQGDQEIRFAA